ncbi:hypothetical protein EIQ13_16370 [Xanthomonas campestris pv. campestris]
MLFYLSDVATWAGQLPGNPHKADGGARVSRPTGRKPKIMAVQALSRNRAIPTAKPTSAATA